MNNRNDQPLSEELEATIRLLEAAASLKLIPDEPYREMWLGARRDRIAPALSHLNSWSHASPFKHAIEVAVFFAAHDFCLALDMRQRRDDEKIVRQVPIPLDEIGDHAGPGQMIHSACSSAKRAFALLAAEKAVGDIADDLSASLRM